VSRYTNSIGIIALGALLMACNNTSSDAPSFGEELSQINSSQARVALLTSTVRRDPENVQALKALGEEHKSSGDWARAANAYREALILNKGDKESLSGYATALVAQRHYAAGFEQAKRALGSTKTLNGQITAGVALDGLNKPSEAQDFYLAALKETPRDLDARNNMAISMAMQGNDQALSQMLGVATAPDADVRHQANLVLVAALTGQVSLARRYGNDFGFSKKETNEIIALAAKARREGAGVIGVASNAR